MSLEKLQLLPLLGLIIVIACTFYPLEVLIKLLSRIKEWNVLVAYKEKETGYMMEKETFYVEIPEYEPEGMGLMLSGRADTGKAYRDYAHPLDSKIIHFLDNDVINGIFKNIVDMMADSSYGSLVAGGIRITENIYPEIYGIVNECIKKLSISMPYVVISPSISGLNAMTFGSDEAPYIVLSPLMVKTMSPTQLKFVIGHECGHIAMGHMTYHTVINIATTFSEAIPLIGPLISKGTMLPLMAWSRRSEISADRAGLLCCDDIDAAKRTLVQLNLPYIDAEHIDIDEYVKNASDYLQDGVIRRLGEFGDAHPVIPKRIHALALYVSSEKYCRVHNRPVESEAVPDDVLEAQIEKTISVL